MNQQLAAASSGPAITALTLGMIVCAAGVNMALHNRRALKSRRPMSPYAPFNPRRRRILMWCGWAFAVGGALQCLAGAVQTLNGT